MLCLGVQGVQLFATPWTAAHQALLSMGILQARTLEWVAMPFSRGSSQPRDRTQVYLHYRWILYYLNDQGSPRSRWVGNLPLLQGIFPTQRLNPDLPHCRQILYQLSHKGSPRILEWATYPFSMGSSWLRNRTSVSCIAGRFFTRWATRKARLEGILLQKLTPSKTYTQISTAA